MAISFRRYVDITSGVGAGVRVPGRQLIGRLFTTNPLAPSGTIITFTEASDVSAFFGSDSEEYRRAAFYFGWISKIQTRARSISFERWVPQDAPATLRGVIPAPSLTQFTNISNGSLALTINGDTQSIMELDFTEALSYADVAFIVETGIRTISGDPFYATALVTFDAPTRTFMLTVGQAGACPITPATDIDVGTPIAAVLGWTEDTGVVTSDGLNAQTITDTLNNSAGQDNNFGTFLFMGELTTDQMVEAATFSNVSNVGFRYCQRVTASAAPAARAALKGYEGVCLDEYDPANTNQYPEMMSMIILAATDFTRLNGTQGYMFQQFTLSPTVTDNTKANTMDAMRVNYYGRTQQAGQLIDFYQRGVLQGANVQDINIYDNEMWLKDRAGADIMTLLLALPKISANDTGRSQVLNCLRDGVINMALNNGAISINKPLNYTQKTFITTVTGDDVAWVQVQSQGYWLDAQIQEYTVDDRVEFKVVYLLVYSKDDLIRKVEGTHSLI